MPTVSPVSWGIHCIAEMLLYSRLDAVYSLGSGEVDLLEIDVPPMLIGKTVFQNGAPLIHTEVRSEDS